MNLSIDLDEEAVKGALCSAFEGGSNYWYMIERYEFCTGVKYEDFQEGGKFQDPKDYWHPAQLIPLADGCNVIISDKENNDKEHVLNLHTIKHGLLTMARKYPKHFGDLVSKDGDATTGDVFLQCCLFNEIIYG